MRNSPVLGASVVAGFLAVAGCTPRGSSSGDTASSSSSSGTSSSSNSSSAVGLASSGGGSSSGGHATSAAPSSGGGSSSHATSAASGASGGSGSSGLASSSVGSSSGGTLSAAADVYLRRLAAQCAHEQTCAAQRGTRHASAADCVEDALSEADRLALAGTPTQLQRLASWVVLDAAAAEACIQAEQNRGCTRQDDVTPAACRVAFMQAGDAVALGQACSDPASCVAGAVCPVYGGPVCAACLPLGGTGDACGLPTECLSGWCVAGQCTETPPTGRALGETCDTSGNLCMGPAVCLQAPAGVTRTCQSLPAAGETCVGGGFNSCQGLSWCRAVGSERRCVRRGEDGAPCTRESFSCVHTCVFSQPQDATGTCATPGALPGAGQPCANGVQCGGGSIPNLPADGSSCVCVTPLADGVPCDPQHPLCAGRCVLQAGGAGQCQPVGPVATTPLGGACTPLTGCAQGDCLLGPGALDLTCQQAACTPFTPCTAAAPGNTTPAAATVVLFDTAVAQDACLPAGPVELWWRLDGPLENGDALSMALEPVLTARGYYAGSVQFHVVRQGTDGLPDLTPRYDPACDATSQPNLCTVFLEGSATSVWVQLQGTLAVPARVTARFAMRHIPLVQTTLCVNPPTNTSNALATPVTPGQATAARFCSSGADTEYYWQVEHAFDAADTLVEVAATPAAGAPLTLMVNVPGSDLYRCDFPLRPGQRCIYNMYRTAAVYVATSGNPSLRQDVDFSFNVTLPSEPGWNCSPAPTNRTGATALPLQVGTPLDALLCGSQAPFLNLYWRVDPVLPAHTLVRLEPPDLAQRGMELRGVNEDFSASCVSPQPCVLDLPRDNAAFYVRLNTSSGEAASTVPLDLHTTTDPLFDACPTPPTNLRPADAVTLASGVPHAGVHCSNAALMGSWFRLPGPFTGGTVSLDVTMANGASATPVLFLVEATPAGGVTNSLGTCQASGGVVTNCQGTLPSGTSPEVLVHTFTNTPGVSEPFSLTLTRP